MNPFPLVDPIPLPAPVWIFKVLHIVTLALHFVAVELLLGSLLVAAWFNFLGRREPVGARMAASAALARRLPIIMTYVINLGVPPLLFAQVLYGRALYTSSVLIGVWWISVIFLLMACYWLLYRFAARAEAGRSGWGLALVSWLLAGAIAKIYVTNMTLMLRPDFWSGMYSATAAGYGLPRDPAIMARWVFMLVGGLAVAGLWMIWLSARQTIADAARKYLATWGGTLAVVMPLALIGAAYWVMSVQPEAVRQGLSANTLYRGAGFAWIAGLILTVLMGAWSLGLKPQSGLAGWLAALSAVVMISGMTVYRDGIRDLTLQANGFNIQGADLWARAMHPNWGVVILFLLLFVGGLGVVGWLISVVARAKPVPEKVQS